MKNKKTLVSVLILTVFFLGIMHVLNITNNKDSSYNLQRLKYQYPFFVGEDETYAIYSSESIGKTGPVRLVIINKSNQDVLGKFKLPFKNSIQGIIPFVNKDLNTPTIALSVSNYPGRELALFNFKTGEMLESSVCHTHSAILYKNYLFYGDCTTSKIENYQDLEQTRLIQKNLETKEEKVIREALEWESFWIDSLTLSTKNSSEDSTYDILQITKSTYIPPLNLEQNEVPDGLQGTETREDIQVPI